jgi:tRNA modification GTPase
MHCEDTICAISTPPGESAIGVIRISGQEAIPIAQRVFQKKPGGLLDQMPTHTIHYGHLVDPTTQEVLDEALVSLLRKPRTFTREDMVEISCHGGPLLLSRAVALLLRYGARLADPGEFTKRAFLNGRIDLSQAEAVMDLIHSKSERSLKIAIGQLQGNLGQEIKALRDQLIDLQAHLEATIDFCEEDLEVITSSQAKKTLAEVSVGLRRLLEGKEEGRILREGLMMAIVGRPNVGKSSLMNALLQEDRAIVTAIPGTTRDILEEWVNIRGIAIKLLDMAGVRKTQDTVEAEGVRRALEAVEQADLVLLLIDSSEPLQGEDFYLIDLVEKKKKIVVLNKCDLIEKIDELSIKRSFSENPVAKISATSHIGLDHLKDMVKDQVSQGSTFRDDDTFRISSRHSAAIEKAYQAVLKAVSAVDQGISPEFLAFDTGTAIDSLGEIIGATTTHDLLDHIFSRFCIGK